MRIISLIASATEIVCSLGLEKYLVGRSHECDWPPSVEALPKCSEPKINIHTSAIEIDRQVKDVVRDSLSVYRVFKDKLKELKPDIIVTQDQCEVCAVSLKDVEEAVCDWVEYTPKLVSLRPMDLNDLYEDIYRVGRAAAVETKAEEVVGSMKARMKAISQKTPKRDKPIRLASIEWVEPLMAAGNWVPELVEMLGVENVFGEAGKHSPYMTFEDLRREDPDVMIVMPCGWDIERTKEEMPVLQKLDGWRDLKAVREGQVYLTDGNFYFNRPSPRVVESLEIMAEILYPQTFNFSHHGAGWQCWGK